MTLSLLHIGPEALRAALARLGSCSVEDAERAAQAFQRTLRRQRRSTGVSRHEEEEVPGSALTMVMALALFAGGFDGHP